MGKQLQTQTIVNEEEFQQEYENKIQEIKTASPKLSSKEKYNAMLDDLARHPSKSINSVEYIVKRILQYKGYPPTIITIEINDISGETQKGSYVAAYFNFQTGRMHINKNALYNLDIRQTIAIIAHELDHFEKINQVCKSMGIGNFSSMMTSYNVQNLNTAFWASTNQYANIKNFDAEFYKNALIRYISQGDIDPLSTYSHLYKIAEHMRNPLEISAYEISDYILEYYKVPNVEGSIQKLIKIFNSLDWAIYNKIKNDNSISSQRIAFFDYFFAKAIAKSHQYYQQGYDYCLNNRDGDFSQFWAAFAKNNSSFYSEGNTFDANTLNMFQTLLPMTEQIVNNTDLSREIVYEALKIKINTSLQNIIYEGAITNIRSLIKSYLLYANKNGGNNPKDELKYLLTLICIENEAYVNNQKHLGSLNNILIPKEFSDVYGITNKNELFKMIYKNSEFINEYSKKKQQSPMLSEQAFLSDFIYNFRPYNKIK